MSYQGLLSGPGGQAIGNELMRLGQNQQPAANPFLEKLISAAPQLAQARQLALYRQAATEKLQSEQATAQKQAGSLEDAAQGIEAGGDPITANLVRSGMHGGDIKSLQDSIQGQQAITAQAQVLQRISTQNPNAFGGIGRDADGEFFKSLSQAIGPQGLTDFTKVGDKLQEWQDQGTLENEMDSALPALTKFGDTISNPQFQAAMKSSGLDPTAEAYKMLWDDLNKGAPETAKILGSAFVKGGPQAMQKVIEEAHKADTEMQLKKTQTGLQQEKTVLTKVQEGLNQAKILTEGTKQVKNLRPPSSGKSSSPEAIQLRKDTTELSSLQKQQKDIRTQLNSSTNKAEKVRLNNQINSLDTRIEAARNKVQGRKVNTNPVNEGKARDQQLLDRLDTFFNKH